MISLDGSFGEGGGQILRSALTLSMVTGTPFTIRHIRANRPKPGLMRQHLVAVQAAAMISDASVTGAHLGSQELSFHPRTLRGGEHRFTIDGAGSSTLVLQTILPALWCADAPSVVRVSGGTHNPMAPPAHFLERAYARILRSMGVSVELEVLRHGFFPAGGGQVELKVQPCSALKQIDLSERGALVRTYAESVVAAVPTHVAARELQVVTEKLGWPPEHCQIRQLPSEEGPGNIVMLTIEHAAVTEVFCSLGEKRLPAEAVAQRACRELRKYLASGAALGEHLADQVMLPMALAGGGCFTTATVSEHARTNAKVIERFLPVRFTFAQDGLRHRCQVKAG